MKGDDPLILALKILLQSLNFEIIVKDGVVCFVGVSEIRGGFFEFLSPFANISNVFTVCKAFC